MKKEALALLGGPKSVTKSLEEIQAKPIPEKAYDTIRYLLDHNLISTAPIVNQFERRFADYIGVQYGLGVCNGTTSIQAALFAVGVKPHDEVIVPSFTFWASVGPIVANGAYPIFADVDEQTHNILPESIERCITKKTKAILVVHVWGNPCDMDAIMAIAKKHNLKVVEDCSHAHGATYKGQKVGSFGDVGCFSMQGSKVLSAGEGGVLVTNDRECFERATALGHYERCKKLGENSPYARYNLTGFGFKHRIAPLSVAVADANLDCLDELNEIRYQNGKKLEALLSDLPFLRFQKEYDGAKRVYAYHYAQYIPEALGGLKLTTLLQALADEGVKCGTCGYGQLHLAPLYTRDGEFAKEFPFTEPDFPADYPASDLPNTKKLAKTAFMLAPRFETATEEDLKEYARAFHKIAENLEELLAYEREHGTDNIQNNGRSINYVQASR